MKSNKKHKFEVEIPKDKIDEILSNKIEALEKENTKLKSKISNLQKESVNTKEKIEKAERIIQAVKDAGGFHDSFGCYGDNCPC